MSPRAILRRQCKRAMLRLIRDFGYSEDQFEIPDTKGSKDDVLSGTPIYWWRCGYECEEWDSEPAVDHYRSLVAANSVDWDQAARETFLRERYEAMRLNPENFRKVGSNA